MKSIQDIRDRINRMEKQAENLYNTGMPVAQSTANEILSEISVLKWVLEE